MKVLITGAWNCSREHIAAIESFGNEVWVLPYEKEKLPCAYEEVEAVIWQRLFLSHPIERFVNLKYIQLTSAGFDRIPMNYVNEHEIQIRNAKGVYSVPMAEFAVSGVVYLYKQMNFLVKSKRAQMGKAQGTS